LALAYLELRCLRNNNDRAYEEERCRFNACLAASTYLSYFKKIYKKVYLKELRLVKQGILKLESKEKGSSLKDLEIVLYSLVVGSLIALRSPLANLFFNPFFSLLPNLISSNMP